MRPARYALLPLVVALAACSTPEAARETTPDGHFAPEPDAAPPTPDDGGDTGPSHGALLPAEATTPGAPLPPIARTPGATETPPDLDQLARWFEGPPLAGALASWKAGERVAAAHALDAFGEAHPDDARALPARFLAAWMLAEGEPDPTVAGRFESLAADWPLLADACHYHAAVAHLGEAELAQARAAALRIAPTSVHWGPAQALVARVFDDENHPDEAKVILEAAVVTAPDSLPADGWARLEKLRDAAGDEVGTAAARYELALRFPTHELGRAALTRLAYGKLAPADRIRLGAALIDAGRPDATRAVVAGLTRPKERACEAWVLLGRAWERKKKDASAAANAWKWYKKALDCSGEARADATFLGGRNRMRNDDAKTGAKLLRAHADEFPKRSTADDVLHMLAEAAKRPRDADKRLVTALTRYPKGDQADEIAWDPVLRHLEKRDWKNVRAAIDKILVATHDRPYSRHGGRYHYWKARAAWELGDKDDARALWRDIVQREPLTWYATLALSRLAAEDAEAAQRLVTAHAPSVPSDSKTTAASTEGRPSAALWADDHFRRAVEWARLAGPFDAPEGGIPAFQESFAAELAAVDPKVRGEDWVWTQIALWELAGDHARAMRLARSEEHARPLAWPTSGTPVARRWRLAYPRPFEALVVRWGKERAIEPSWIWSVARVESNFEPTAVSWANAIGLMQIIPPTAEFLAKGTTIEPTREALMKPEVALELGTKYLARLLAKHQHYPLASAGYNAGGGAVSRWRRERGDLDLDEFVERIPYNEANNYAKSVTQTLARYLWLYEGRVLTLAIGPPGLPSDPSPTEGATPVATPETAPEVEPGAASEEAAPDADGGPAAENAPPK